MYTSGSGPSEKFLVWTCNKLYIYGNWEFENLNYVCIKFYTCRACGYVEKCMYLIILKLLT
jgi:hypothetical protein